MAELNKNSSTPELSDLIAEYALGTLSPEERSKVESLLATSEDASRELRAVQEMLGAMAVFVPARQAPAHLTADFRQRLAANPGRNPAQALPSVPARAPRRLVSRWSILAAAAVLIIAFGLFVVYRATQIDPERQEIQQILAAANAQKIQLAAQNNAVGNATLVIVPNSAKAVLVAALPTLPDDKAYQLWLIQKNTPESARVFQTGDKAELLITMPNPISAYDVTAITVEPKAGSRSPTTAPLFAAPISG